MYLIYIYIFFCKLSFYVFIYVLYNIFVIDFIPNYLFFKILLLLPYHKFFIKKNQKK